MSAAYGSRDTIAVEGAGGGQLGENLSVRASLKYQERGDSIDNVVNGPGDDFGAFDEFAYRLQFLYDSDSFRGLLKLHGFQQDGTQPRRCSTPTPSHSVQRGCGRDSTRRSQDHDGGASMELDHYGAALNLQWDFGSSTYTSITGYDTVENFQSTDVDGGLLSFDPPGYRHAGQTGFFQRSNQETLLTTITSSLRSSDSQTRLASCSTRRACTISTKTSTYDQRLFMSFPTSRKS